jgi:hypothetical protein
MVRYGYRLTHPTNSPNPQSPTCTVGVGVAYRQVVALPLALRSRKRKAQALPTRSVCLRRSVPNRKSAICGFNSHPNDRKVNANI